MSGNGDNNKNFIQDGGPNREDEHSNTHDHIRDSRNILYPSPPPPPPPQMYLHPTQGFQNQMRYETILPGIPYIQPNSQIQSTTADNREQYPPPPPQVAANYKPANDPQNHLYDFLKGIETRLGSKLGNIESRFTKMETQMESQAQNWNVLENTLEKQNTRITNLEHSVNTARDMKTSMANMHLKVDNLDQAVNSNTAKLYDCEASVKTVSYLYDEEKGERQNMYSEIKDLRKEVESLRKEGNSTKDRQDDQEEKLLDLQCRSMRDNLIFFGIHEEENTNNYDQAEIDLDKFIYSVMEVDRKIQFERVHRLGRKRYDPIRPRPIIAKFSSFKDREIIRHSASTKLADTDYGIKEQFPREIEERRKPLYQEMKKAKNDGKKATLVKDKLYIDKELHNPTRNERRPMFNRTRGNKSHTYPPAGQPRMPFNRNITFTNSGRVFHRSTPPQNQQMAANREINFETPNRYQRLAQLNSQDSTANQKKRGPRSPLEAEMQSKKQKESSDSGEEFTANDDSDNVILVDEEQQNPDEPEKPQDTQEDQDETMTSDKESEQGTREDITDTENQDGEEENPRS